MASLQFNTLPGETVCRALNYAADVAGQRTNRLCDITVDLTAGVITVTENLADQGPKVQKF